MKSKRPSHRRGRKPAGTRPSGQTAEPAAARGGLRKKAAISPDAEECARAGEARFRAIANSLPSLIAFVDSTQRYQFCNRSYEKSLGVPKGEFIGRSLRQVIGQTAYAKFRPFVRKALSGQPVSYEGYTSHKRFGRRYLHIDYVPHRNERGMVDGFYSVIRDMTELKDAEEKFRAFVENAPVAIIIHSPNGKMAVANSQAERLFGFSRDEMVGQPVEILMPERMRRRHRKELIAYMKKPRARPMGIGLELTAMRKDGDEFPVEISLSPMHTVAGTFISATVLDLTDRKRLEEQTRLAALLQERANVARDLHDTLAQGLTGIIMLLEEAEETSPNLPRETRIHLEKAAHVAHENLEEVRRFLEELSGNHGKRPASLPGSLRKLASRYPQNGKARVKFSLRGMPRPLNAVVKENLLFIARQAIDNALQHAHASKIRISLTFAEKDLRVQVQDDGRGFNVKKADHGFGLTGMSDRAKYIGGQFKLNSHRKTGTLVEVTVPLSDGRPLITSP